jgi:hypothetical protein
MTFLNQVEDLNPIKRSLRLGSISRRSLARFITVFMALTLFSLPVNAIPDPVRVFGNRIARTLERVGSSSMAWRVRWTVYGTVNSVTVPDAITAVRNGFNRDPQFYLHSSRSELPIAPGVFEVGYRVRDQAHTLAGYALTSTANLVHLPSVTHVLTHPAAASVAVAATTLLGPPLLYGGIYVGGKVRDARGALQNEKSVARVKRHVSHWSEKILRSMIKRIKRFKL